MLVLCDFSGPFDVAWDNSIEFVVRMSTVMAHARSLDVAIAYCERADYVDRGWPQELARCRPRISDPIFNRAAASCFTNRDFFDKAQSHQESGIYFAGFNATRSLLASVLDAEALGLRTGVLMDLCGYSARMNNDDRTSLMAAAMMINELSLAAHSNILFD